MTTEIIYGEWLRKELDQRQWSDAQFAKMIGKSRSVIGRICNRLNKKEDPETCVAIARVLGKSPVTVFRIAKILPPEPVTIPLDDFTESLSRVPEEGQKEVLKYAVAIANTRISLQK